MSKIKMTKKEFEKLTGEDPEDMFGGDWENEIEDHLTERDIHPRPEDHHQLLNK